MEVEIFTSLATSLLFDSIYQETLPSAVTVNFYSMMLYTLDPTESYANQFYKSFLLNILFNRI